MPRRPIVNALKALPASSGRFSPVNSAGTGRISPAMWEQYAQNSYLQAYGKFLPRSPSVFSDGAFAPAPPIIPTPVDQPPPGGQYPGPRWWQYRQAWNLPTPPGTEGLKLASFDQLRTLSEKYSVARACLDLRMEEIRGLEWSVVLTTNAAKAYRGDSSTMRELGGKIAEFTRFFRRPDPDFWNFDSFMNAFLEEIFVYDALSVIFRPKFGSFFGMGGRGLLGSDLDSLRLVSGPTMRPLIDLHGGKPAPPAPAYQQFLYGVPRSDYMTIAMGTDIDDSGLAGAEVNAFDADIMLYAPYWPRRESPYGFPPVERALLPIISGIQKQEFQLDYFTEGSVPAVYISPGDNSITPTQIAELQSALNAIAGDVAYHQKVVVLPPGSKVQPQRPVDLSDGFDLLVQTQVCMAFDVQPIELGILPNIGGASAGAEGGGTASGVRFASQESRNLKSRKSTKPLLKFICDIFNYVIQDICHEKDLKFQFEGLEDDEDRQAITDLGVEQIQNGISSIDEIRERLDLPPWGMPETSEPIIITQQGPVPFSMAPQLLQAQLTGNGQANDNSKLPSARRGTGGTNPSTGSHPAPLSPAKPNALTPSHAAAEAQVARPVRGQSGGSASRSPVAGSRKRGEARSPTQGRLRNKAIESELEALGRHLRKGREISTWVPVNITDRHLGMIAEDTAKGVLIDVAVARAASVALTSEEILAKEEQQWPGWQHDIALVGEYRGMISQAFQDTEIQGRELRKEAAAGKMFVSAGTLHDLVSGIARDVFIKTMTPLWTKAWDLGYDSAVQLTGNPVAPPQNTSALQNFLDTEGTHWLEQIARTGLGNSDARSEIIARTEVARAMNTAAIQAYRDNGVTHKHLLVSPENCCDACMAAKAEGDIPLDAIFPGGNPPFHPQCRCAPAPAGIAVTPPQAHVKSAKEDHSRLAWILLRSEDESGRQRFLLQQRPDGTWGMPGGTPHLGEDSWGAAVREVTEEIGDLPPLKITRTFHHVEDDGKTQVYLWLCDVPYFQPRMNGSTPEETQGAAWFRKKEIPDLDLTPKFREDWEKGIKLKDNATKAIRSTENGELLEEDPRYGAGTGSNWPYPRRSDGGPALDGPDGRPVPQNNRPGGGQVTGEMGAIEPPFIQDDMSDETHAVLYPDGTEENFPRRRTRNRGPKKLPHGPDGQWPGHENPGSPGAGAQGVPGGPVRG